MSQWAMRCQQDRRASRSTGVTSYTITPPAEQVALLQQAYAALRESVYGALVMQTRLKPYLDSVELTIDDAGVQFNTSGIVALALQTAQTNPGKAVTDLVDLRYYFKDTLDRMEWSFGDAIGPVLSLVEITPELSALLASEQIVRMGLAGDRVGCVWGAGRVQRNR